MPKNRRALVVLTLLSAVLATLLTAGALGDEPPTEEATGTDRMPAAIDARLEQRYDRPDAAARRWIDRRRSADGRGIDLTTRYRWAQRQRDRMPRFSSRAGAFMKSFQEDVGPMTALPSIGDAPSAKMMGAWEPLGPGNVGGRTRALLIDPTNPRVMYAAGVSGGVWKSTNGGRRWRPLIDLLPNIAVSAMAMDPADSRTIYAGTGEGFFREVVRGTSLPLRGNGILKTTDAGATWTRLRATRNANFHWVNDIVVSANDSRTVYAATRSGVFRSRDAGNTWRRVLDPEVIGGCLDLALVPTNGGDLVLASCGTFTQATVYRNARAEGDGAWQVALRDPGMGRTSLAVAPSDPRIVYALAAAPGQNVGAGVHGLFRSNRSGAPGSWRTQLRPGDHPIGTLLLDNAVIANLRFCGFGDADEAFTFGWYTNLIAVDPVDPDIVFAGGVDLFRSNDGGRSWGPINYWWTDPPINSHADMHVIAFHPGYDGVSNRRMFLGNDGGVFETVNARAPTSTARAAICNPNASSVRWTSRNLDYGVTQFYHGAPIPPDGQRVIGGTQDNGTVIGGSINGWRRVFGGDGGYVAIDPRDANVMYVESQFLNLQKSTDGGASFRAATSGIMERVGGTDTDDNEVLFITPFLLDPNDPDRLFTGGRRVWRTDNGAQSWRQASPVLAGGTSRISALAVSTVDPDLMLVGTSDGRIFRQTAARTAGATTIWNGTRPRGGFVAWLAFDPVDANLAYATYAGFGGRHVWRSRDGGLSWRAIDGNGRNGIPDLPVHAIVVDPSNPRRLYLGTDLGVYVSLDGGDTWAAEQSGFPNAVTESLAILRRPSGATFLYAFTHGRGAWRVRIDAGSGGGDGGGGGGPCDLPAGHGRFCSECGACGDGQGDCDSDSECAAGLRCVDNIGAQFGFAPGVDVCVASGGDGGGDGGGGGPCNLPTGHGRFCSDCGPCGEGQGDCDRDSECAAGLTCVDNIGAQFGFAPGVDVCVPSDDSGGGGSCTAGLGTGRFCTECGPCGVDQGDCDSDAECLPGLRCVENIGAQFGFGAAVDVCQPTN